MSCLGNGTQAAASFSADLAAARAVAAKAPRSRWRLPTPGLQPTSQSSSRTSLGETRAA